MTPAQPPAMRALAAAWALLAALCGCATPPDEVRYPLDPCTEGRREACIRPLFKGAEDVLPRRENRFPAHYLELHAPEARQLSCDREGGSSEDKERCAERLARVAEYFATGLRASAPIGVSLEGGGSKAAPFALGTLAALQQLGLLEDGVSAIASVSGGSYAASYYFNRLYDRSLGDPSTPPTAQPSSEAQE